MSLLEFIKPRLKWTEWVVALLLLLLFNISHFVTVTYSKQQNLQQLINFIPEDITPTEDTPIWLSRLESGGLEFGNAVNGISYKPATINSRLVFIDQTLLIPASGWLSYFLLNLALLACCVFWLFMRHRRERHLQDEISELDNVIRLLQDKVNVRTTTEPQKLSQKLNRITERIGYLLKREQEIRHLVRVQGLIDHELAVGNRIFFESKLQHYLSDNSEAECGALFIVQISHPEQDLAAISQITRLKGCIDIISNLLSSHTEAVLARLSDNDLALLIPGMSDKEMERLADRMAVLLGRASCFADCEEQDLVHIGYATYQRGQTSYQVLSEADMALKTAQLHGPNAAYGFTEQQKPPLKGSVWWRSELTKALQEQRFLLTFQPVFSWPVQEVLQQEVLIRLQTSQGDKIPAAIFLPMAYNCGLSVQIDQHVLLKTARLCAAEHKTANRCSVNISIQTLLSNSWWEWLEQCIETGQIKPELLTLELSEHHLVKHYTQVKQRILRLHDAGFVLVVDHVGLTIDTSVYADELPVESIKLHPSVVRNIDQHLEQQLFVRGLIAGYASKGIRVIATGIELEDEWLVLQKLGIAGGQGFYFSQPLSHLITQTHL